MTAVENQEPDTTSQSASADAENQDATAQVDKSGQRIQKMFGEISGRYDFLNHFLSGGVDYYWRWRTVRRVRPEGDSPILDVCTGTGDLAIAYWKKAGGKVDVVGTDFTHEMLVIAREKSAKLGIPAQSATTNQEEVSGKATLRFLEADTMQLPLESDSFQIVSVAFGLRNVSDTLGGLREGASAFIGPEQTALAATSVDPLPQALVLTAIVISFGVLAFTLAMVHRADQSTGTDDINELKSTDT